MGSREIVVLSLTGEGNVGESTADYILAALLGNLFSAGSSYRETVQGRKVKTVRSSEDQGRRPRTFQLGEVEGFYRQTNT